MLLQACLQRASIFPIRGNLCTTIISRAFNLIIETTSWRKNVGDAGGNSRQEFARAPKMVTRPVVSGRSGGSLVGTRRNENDTSIENLLRTNVRMRPALPNSSRRLTTIRRWKARSLMLLSAPDGTSVQSPRRDLPSPRSHELVFSEYALAYPVHITFATNRRDLRGLEEIRRIVVLQRGRLSRRVSVCVRAQAFDEAASLFVSSPRGLYVYGDTATATRPASGAIGGACM